ncbi:endonuclease/exonuclease/phosphatase family protein [Streptomyces sp. NPDC059740]|uniref:endonuclease/exonuclease/phosphatase family protein n=1 Tax=Streptomyces sp. NPDC059740 TaxID=3346926 RepID=UPI00364FC398
MNLCRRTARLLLTAGLVGALATGTAAVAAPAPGGAGAGNGPRGAVPLRVASYNIHAGAGMDGVFDLDRTAAAVRDLHADVVGLQEVDVHWDARSRWLDLAAELGARLHMHVFFAPIYDEDPATAGAPRRQYGVAILSKYRFEETANHDLTRLSTQDPDPRPAPGPGFAEVVLRVHGVPVHVYDTHLDYRSDPAVRTLQVADTRRIMAEDCGTRGRCPLQFLLGDFNAGPGAPELAPLWQELRRADAGVPSWPADTPRTALDYVTGSRDRVSFRDTTVVDTQASDHRPVVTDALLRRGR